MKTLFNFKSSTILIGLMIGSILVASCEKETEVSDKNFAGFENILENFKKDNNLSDTDIISFNKTNYTVGDIDSYEILRSLYDMIDNSVRTEVTELEGNIFLYQFFDTLREEDLSDLDSELTGEFINKNDPNPRVNVKFYDGRDNRNKTINLYKNDVIQFGRHKFKRYFASSKFSNNSNDLVTFQANIGGKKFGLHRGNNGRSCTKTFSWGFKFRKHARRNVYMKSKKWFCKY